MGVHRRLAIARGQAIGATKIADVPERQPQIFKSPIARIHQLTGRLLRLRAEGRHGHRTAIFAN